LCTTGWDSAPPETPTKSDVVALALRNLAADEPATELTNLFTLCDRPAAHVAQRHGIG